jgi:REP element-mobilizing transposase RayT
LRKESKQLSFYIMSEIIGYMLTWTTYGSWLPGDKRGYVDDGRTFNGDIEILKRNKQRQKSLLVKLNAQEKDFVKQVIRDEAKKINHKIEALSFRGSHVHLVARPHSTSIEDVVEKYKGLTTRFLWQKGRKGRIWTKGYDKRFCFTEQELDARIKYVQNHNT